jgi:hypothetical protein
MAEPLPAIDVTDVPELRRLAEEVNRTGQARVLRRDGKDLALVAPMPPVQNQLDKPVTTEADLEAFRSSFGGWKDFDLDQFLKNLEESRRSSHPFVELD